jgi:predicted TIM-barrel fold metal-dependent hydrolase
LRNKVSSSLSRRRVLAPTTAVSAVAALGAPARVGAAETRSPSAGRIDCQSHLFCPEVVALMEERKTDPRVYTKDGVRVVQMGDWLRKLVCPHLGGTLPYIVGRLDHQVNVLKRGPRNLQRSPSDSIRSIWLDVVSPLPLAIKFGHEFMGPDRLLYSSDHPWVEPSLIVSCVQEAKLPAMDERKIFSENARKLFRL